MPGMNLQSGLVVHCSAVPVFCEKSCSQWLRAWRHTYPLSFAVSVHCKDSRQSAIFSDSQEAVGTVATMADLADLCVLLADKDIAQTEGELLGELDESEYQLGQDINDQA